MSIQKEFKYQVLSKIEQAKNLILEADDLCLENGINFSDINLIDEVDSLISAIEKAKGINEENSWYNSGCVI